jgi:transposase
MNDARDAEAICEAVTRPSMRFVPVKDVEQQTVLALSRARQGFVVERTAQSNRMRGMLQELGIVIQKGRVGANAIQRENTTRCSRTTAMPDLGSVLVRRAYGRQSPARVVGHHEEAAYATFEAI